MMPRSSIDWMFFQLWQQVNVSALGYQEEFCDLQFLALRIAATICGISRPPDSAPKDLLALHG